MAGGQPDGQPDGRSDGQPDNRPGGRPDDRSTEHSEGLTGGLSGGEWWRVDDLRRVLGGAAPPQVPADDGEGVYLSGAATRRADPEVPLGPPGPEVPVPPLRSFFRKPRAPEPPEPAAVPTEPAAAWPIAPASSGPVRPPTTADFPGWDSVVIEFPPDDTEPAEPSADEARLIPDQRGTGQEPEADPVAGTEGVVGGAPVRSFLAGRRPSPLLLLAAAVLVGGAVTGVILVLLVGWALAYLSQRLGELTRKFAVFGIPLITMSASTLWFWGRSEGRWGESLAKGAPMTHAALSAAPGVLRLAAVLSALFLFAVAMRRRSPRG